jgi:hypothetical protein
MRECVCMCSCVFVFLPYVKKGDVSDTKLAGT